MDQSFPKVDSTKPSRKREEIKKIFLEWSLMSTSHCYPKIFQYKNIYAKILWIIFFLGFAACTFCFLIFGLLDFFEFEVISKIRVFNEHSLLYPTVTICDANPLTTKEAENLITDANIQTIDFINRKDKNYSITETIYNMYSFTIYGMKRAFDLDDKGKQSLGFSIQSILHLCTFNGKTCDASDFHWVFSYAHGNCFQYNSESNATQPLKETKLGGTSYGLMLLIRNLTNANKHPTFFSSGLKLFIHNGSFISSSAKEIFVEAGKHTSIAMKKIFTYRAPAPHSECKDLTNFKSELYNHIKNLNGQYRQNDCFELCLQKIIIENCKCFLSTLPLYYTKLAPCSTPNNTACFVQSYYDNSANLDAKCIQECPLECDYVTYDLTLSTLDYPSRAFFNDLKNNSYMEYTNTSFDEFKQTHLALNIFYPNKEFTEIRETPKMKLVDLVSNLGGALGIFLGFSIFSFVEVFEIVIQIFYITLKKN